MTSSRRLRQAFLHRAFEVVRRQHCRLHLGGDHHLVALAGGAHALAHFALVVVHLRGVDVAIADADRLLDQPRAVAPAQRPGAETDDRNLEAFGFDRVHLKPSFSFGDVVGKAAQVQRLHPGRAAEAAPRSSGWPSFPGNSRRGTRRSCRATPSRRAASLAACLFARRRAPRAGGGSLSFRMPSHTARSRSSQAMTCDGGIDSSFFVQGSEMMPMHRSQAQ